MANAFGGSASFGNTGEGSGGGLDIQALLSMLSGGLGQYQKFIQNPTQSPLYQNQLQGLLAALHQMP